MFLDNDGNDWQAQGGANGREVFGIPAGSGIDQGGGLDGLGCAKCGGKCGGVAGLGRYTPLHERRRLLKLVKARNAARRTVRGGPAVLLDQGGAFDDSALVLDQGGAFDDSALVFDLEGLGFFKKLGKVFKKLAPAALSLVPAMIPGAGGAIAAAATSLVPVPKQKTPTGPNGGPMLPLGSRVTTPAGSGILTALQNGALAVVDELGRVLAQKLGEKWTRTAPVPTINPTPGGAPAGGGAASPRGDSSMLPVVLVVGAPAVAAAEK